ncbi:MAG TPA: aminopeptidase N [Gammaproteobacteria bacterium]|nr:aminopeptidase N [Gammaproteobacteria bacterium]
MKGDAPRAIYLKDYKSPDYTVDTVNLEFDLYPDHTQVRADLTLRRLADEPVALQLDGQEMELLAILIDGQALTTEQYTLGLQNLLVPNVPAAFTLTLKSRLAPGQNTALEGLYLSDGVFCTQCEAEGFRKITWFPDRPDVMATYTTTIIADKEAYPVLLSNGNPVESGELDNNRHWVKWHDPFPKPSYLFALVAGDLHCQSDRYTTISGRKIDCRIYVEHENAELCDHAMRSLQKSMHWDEQVFGLEYDLEIYMIVAVNAFNMGAMENKGLNVFNSRYVLASPETATDDDYIGIENVIGHEYFHNWTGNRVTCRDWFQLSLKEGLTVFRDQEFSADVTSRPVRRIQDVRALRSAQFPEDAGPMAHPVRPASYVEINNFYTTTVYNKGAEVVRMYQTLLGVEGFRRGMDLYFQRHDGQAVTTDDFLAAMRDANQAALTGFERWYDQAGTPVVQVSSEYDAATAEYSLTFEQHCPATPGQAKKEPFVIPIRFGLLNLQGAALPIQLDQDKTEPDSLEKTKTLVLSEASQTFRFKGVSEQPLPSLLRGYSAPVKLEYDYTDQQLAFLLAHDTDEFNRWEAAQKLAIRLIMQGQESKELPADSTQVLADALQHMLADDGLDAAFKAEVLALPSESYLGEFQQTIAIDANHQLRELLRKRLAGELAQSLGGIYKNEQGGSYSTSAQEMGKRALRNTALSYLMTLGDQATVQSCVQQSRNADNMTDVIAALAALVHHHCLEQNEALAQFADKWQHQPLVMDKWFAIQATSPGDDTLATVQGLMSHPSFSIKNPNKVRALIGSFCMRNPVCFHDSSGKGYDFLTEQVAELDKINPQIAARLLGSLSRWRRYDQARQQQMRQALEQISNTSGLSPDCYEVVEKSLADQG